MTDRRPSAPSLVGGNSWRPAWTLRRSSRGGKIQCCARTTPSDRPALAPVALAALMLGAGVVVSEPARGQDDPRIEAMQRQIDELQRQLNELKGEVRETREVPPPPAAAPVAAAPPAAGKPVITSANDKVTLAISGQINRAINIANDGESTKYYNVDNDASNSRVRFVGTGEVTDDLTLGTKIEVAIAPNDSSQVSQDQEDTGNFFDERYVEAWVDSKRFGKLSLGKGNSASNNTAEVDLSGLDVIQYASIADIAGGLEFRDNDGDLTDTTISDAFSDFDGLSRQNRVRYDTPRFYGFGLAGSAISNQRYDGAVTWAGEGYGFKMAAAGGMADRNVSNQNFRLDGSASVLHEASGLNLTVSSGFDQADDGGNPSNLYVKGGWIANFFDIGSTNFGIDYTLSNNNPSPSDHGFSVGGAAVQNLTNFGTQLYTQVRLYDLSSDPSTQSIWVGTVGTRVKF